MGDVRVARRSAVPLPQLELELVSSAQWIPGRPPPGNVIGALTGRERCDLTYQCAFCGEEMPGCELTSHPCFLPCLPGAGRVDLDAYDPDVEPYYNQIGD